MKECSLHGTFSVSLFQHFPTAVELSKVLHLQLYLIDIEMHIDRDMICFISDAVLECQRVMFWACQLLKGKSFSCQIRRRLKANLLNIKLGKHYCMIIKIFLSVFFKAPELIMAFDEHRVSQNFKFGVLYQREGQVHACTEIMFCFSLNCYLQISV